MSTILIADDSPEMRQYVCTVLTRNGYRVLEAGNGKDAVALCHTAHPDLVMTDVLIPEMDGYEMVRYLRIDSALSDIPVIFLTSLYKAGEAQSVAEQCGVQHVLQKPCPEEQILQAVSAAITSPPPAFREPEAGLARQHSRRSGDVLLRNEDERALVSRLAESERQYREMFEGHPAPMWVLDAKSLAFLSVNDAAVRHYGYSREEFLAQSIIDIVPAEDIPASLASLRIAGGGPANSGRVSRHYRKNKELIEVELTTHKLQFCGRAAYSVLAHDVTERNQYEKNLRESEEKLRLLASRLQHVREEERAHLARELHDDLGQSLTAIKMSLSWLAAHPGAPAELVAGRIASTMQLADRTITAARRLASELRPGILDLGLQAAVEWQVQEFRYHAEIRCELEFPAGEIPLSGEQEVALFRIFQETLTNVARHSGASLVTVRLNVDDGQVTFAVQDNGRGITPDELAKRSSLGLLGMRERVLSLGGTMEIEGTTGVGTLVRVRVPLPPPSGRG